MPHNDPKHRAKRWNERVKLVANLFNAIAIVTLAAVVINPIASRHFDMRAEGTALLPFAAVASHIVAQYALAFIEAEDEPP